MDSIFRTVNDYRLTSWLFLKLLAVIYFAAFFSLSGQIAGLAGPEGILPFHLFLDNAFRESGFLALLDMPTLFWLDSSALTLKLSALAGCIFSLLLLFGYLPSLSLTVLFILYLSLYHAGQVFMNFQWDYLLLETGFLAIFLARAPNRLVIFLFHWLLFRLRFLSGISKIFSGDESWQSLSALEYYFETQPLPHAGAWYAHQLPSWILTAGSGLVLLSELLVPFFIFLPRPYRLFAAAFTLLVQLAIIATSNHNFINLLTILLCLFLLDDHFLDKLIPTRMVTSILKGIQPDPGAIAISRLLLGVSAGLILISSATAITALATPVKPPQVLMRVYTTTHNFGLGNIYHVFPAMQTERHELQIEGSDDGANWRPYIFKYKPGPLDRAPLFIVPHQPRLDWMMWFVPTHHPRVSLWFNLFMEKLWQGQPAVLDLLEYNPFPGSSPRYLRVLVYKYRFTSAEERRSNSNWWKKTYLGEFPQVAPRAP